MPDVNYEKDVTIDPDELDVEWINQPNLFFRYSKACSKARAEMDAAKEELEYTKAQLDGLIRSNPAGFGFTKITEAVVSNTILLQPQYIEASKKLLEKKAEYELLLAAVRAMDQKKSALEALVKLLSMEYFAGPIEPRNLKEKLIDKAAVAAKKVRRVKKEKK